MGLGQAMELSLNLGFAGFSSSDRVEKVSTSNVVRQGKGDFDYLRSLEEEMKKIEPFRRELPLCMILLETTVERFRKGTRNGTAEDAATATPSIECLFPLKRKSSDKELGEVSRIGKKRANSFDDGGLFKGGFAPDDGRGNPVHLDHANDSTAEDHGGFLQLQKKSSSAQKCSVKRDNGCSLSLMSPTSVLANQASANAKSGCSSKLIFGSSFVADQMKLQNKSHQQHMIQQQQNQGMFKKQRRSWSAELHQHFLKALEKLGGAQAATPKQIRKMMKVQGLTNDEVKSHLQKYRLNIWRLQNPSEDPNSYKAASGKSNVGGEEEEEEYRENSDGNSWVTGLSEKLLVA